MKKKSKVSMRDRVVAWMLGYMILLVLGICRYDHAKDAGVEVLRMAVKNAFKGVHLSKNLVRKSERIYVADEHQKKMLGG